MVQRMIIVRYARQRNLFFRRSQLALLSIILSSLSYVANQLPNLLSSPVHIL